jgi:hypothetical protein
MKRSLVRAAGPCLLFTALAWSALPGTARAQGTSADAEELFKQGRAALDAQNYAVACQKLAASLQIERAVGTLMSLAKCEEASNKLASARQHWQEAADFADATNDRLNRGPACRAKFAEIDKRVPRLTVNVPAGAPPDLVVKRDGVALVAATLGSPMPVDPGAHTLETSAPGHDPSTASVTLAEGESKTVAATLGPVNAAAASLPPAAGEPAPGPAAPGAAAESGGMGPLFWTGVVVAGVGVVAGGVFGGVAASKAGGLSGECPNHVCSSSGAQSDYSSAKSMALVADVAFGVAGAGAVVAVVGAVTGHKTAEKPGVSLWFGPGSAGVRGAF